MPCQSIFSGGACNGSIRVCHLLLVFIGAIAAAVAGEASFSDADVCAAQPAPVSGTALWQNTRLKTRLGGVSAASSPTDAVPAASVPKAAAGDSHGALPSMSLLQAFSSGSGTKRISSHHEARPRKNGVSFLRQSGTLGTRLLYMAPLGISLVASGALLALVYCIGSSKQSDEDETVSRVLGSMGGVSASGKETESQKAASQKKRSQEEARAAVRAVNAAVTENASERANGALVSEAQKLEVPASSSAGSGEAPAVGAGNSGEKAEKAGPVAAAEAVAEADTTQLLAEGDNGAKDDKIEGQ